MSKKVYQNIFDLVGNTPLVELTNYNNIHNLQAKIIGKIEYFNPINSVKDRIVKAMLEDAETRGIAIPGKTTLVEVTSGNTGIAVAAIAATKGYKARIYIQDFVSKERKELIKAFGAELYNLGEVPEIKKTLDETNSDFVAAIAKFKSDYLAKEKDIFFFDQVANFENSKAHYHTTGKEIWEDTEGNVDVFVAAVGTGGTLTGVGKYLKSKNKNIKIIGVQAKEDQTGITGVHPFINIPEDQIPKILDRHIYDEVITVDEQDAREKAKEITKTDAIFVGASSGAALFAATEIAKRKEFAGKTIVTLFPDTGLRYLSEGFYKD